MNHYSQQHQWKPGDEAMWQDKKVQVVYVRPHHLQHQEAWIDLLDGGSEVVFAYELSPFTPKVEWPNKVTLVLTELGNVCCFVNATLVPEGPSITLNLKELAEKQGEPTMEELLSAELSIWYDWSDKGWRIHGTDCELFGQYAEAHAEAVRLWKERQASDAKR